jgi:hypothetical protein
VADSVPGRDAAWSLFGVGGGRVELAPRLEQQLTRMIDAVTPPA